MVDPTLNKPDDTALFHRLNKTLRDSKEVFDLTPYMTPQFWTKS